MVDFIWMMCVGFSYITLTICIEFKFSCFTVRITFCHLRTIFGKNYRMKVLVFWRKHSVSLFPGFVCHVSLTDLKPLPVAAFHQVYKKKKCHYVPLCTNSNYRLYWHLLVPDAQELEESEADRMRVTSSGWEVSASLVSPLVWQVFFQCQTVRHP